MNRLSRSNLQEFCRTCLSSLRPENSSVESMIISYNISLVPNLAKLLALFLSLEDSDEYPQSLCQLCYDKILDFQQFRQFAQQSAEVLYGIVNCIDGIREQKSVVKNESVSQRAIDSDDDDQLLLPELGPLLQKSIKAEPLDIDDSSAQMHTPTFQHSIKNEIDSEFEEENSTFYENNALGTSYDSIGDDADDEEFALRNGAANTSSAALNNSTTSPSRQRFGNASARKRDRNKKSLKCPRCDKQVYKQVYLEAHIRGVHEGHEKPFLCSECQKAFTRYNQLHVHIQSKHLLEQKFVCEIDGCDAVFKLSNTLDTHRKVVHLSECQPFSINIQEVFDLHQVQLGKEIEMDHICQQCFKKYSSKRALSEHLKRHAQIKEHICKECGVAKVTRTELLTHMRTHEPNLEKFKCTICPQEFNHKNAISRHIRVVHEGQRRFACSFCSKRFGTRNSQVCHERLHTGERPYICEMCNKAFAQSEGLKSHMKNHDKNLRKHVCTYCAQRFITRKNLIDHESRHRGEKPHICTLCSRGFFKEEELQMHWKTTHTGEELNAEGDGMGMDYGSSQSSN